MSTPSFFHSRATLAHAVPLNQRASTVMSSAMPPKLHMSSAIMLVGDQRSCRKTPRDCVYAFSHHQFSRWRWICASVVAPQKSVCGAPCANKGFCEYAVNQGFFDDLRCAPDLISLHKLLFLAHVFPDFCACGTHCLPCGFLPAPGVQKRRKQRCVGSLHCCLFCFLRYFCFDF